MRREPREDYLDFNKSVVKITEAHCSDRTKSMAGSWSNEWLHCNWLDALGFYKRIFQLNLFVKGCDGNSLTMITQKIKPK